MPLVTFDNVEHMLPGQGDTVTTVLNALNGTVPVDASVSPAVTQPTGLHAVAITLPDAATTTYSYLFADKYQLVDVICRKSVAGAGNTVQVKDGAGNAITDAMATAVDKTITRAGTIDPAFDTPATATGFQITNSRSAGSSLCHVTLLLRRRG